MSQNREMKANQKNLIKKSRYSTHEPFSVKKFRKSLKRSGASKSIIDKIVVEIEDMLTYNIVNSSQIHRYSLKLLKKYDPIVAANYSLKRGLEQLGPSGYPFEVLCGEILKEYGYKTKVGVKIKGEFVSHEVDVHGLREDKNVMCECKYHNYNGKKNDVKIPLYIHSRARDINNNSQSANHDEFIIFSNTKFTLDAQKYAQGVGMRLVSLDNNDENIIEYIKKKRLYPITCLSSLTHKMKTQLLDKKIVTIGQLLNKKAVLSQIEMKSDKITKVLNEAQDLYEGSSSRR